MAKKARTFCIAGAGIAGMSLALALAKYGANVTVLEKNSHIQEAGAGLQISPNAGKILRDLGVEPRLEQIGFEPEGIQVYAFKNKKPTVTLNLGDTVTKRYGYPYRVFHRADLAQQLHFACRRFANIDIRFDVENIEVEDQRDSGIKTTFTTPTGPEALRSAAFVGADGVGSPTRQAVLGGSAPRDTGIVAWRTIIPIGRLTDILSRTHTSLLLGPGFHAVAYPLGERDEINIALFAPLHANQPANAPQLPENAREDPRFAAILAAAYDWTYWPLASVNTSTWHKGKIGLIGDAAHAMLPFQAQGAAMAIEDAMELAPLLIEGTNIVDAFTLYEKKRRKRVEKIASISSKNGDIFHMSGPLTKARDLVMRIQGRNGHFRRLDWIYDYASDTESRKTTKQ